MIKYHIEVIDKVGHDIFININLQTTCFTSIEVDSKVRRIYFHNCWFSESEGQVYLKKM